MTISKKSKKGKKGKKAAPYLRRALEDERVHDHVRTAAGSARAAIVAMRRPPPPPPKRRGRKLMLVVLVVAAGVLIAKRAGREDDVRDTSDRAPEPVEPGRSAHPGRSTADAA